MNFQEECNRRTERINSLLAEYLPKEKSGESGPSTVIQAMNYSVLAGGKRLRPILMEETFRLFEGAGDVIRPFMAAIEMIHTYSLVHDDLPAMDNDEYRRGKKTTHAVYGEAMGILAGDGLLNYAFETACGAFSMAADEKTYKRIAEALRILGRKAGVYGMVGGQAADLEAVDRQISREQLEFIFDRKTGALIEGSMMIGAVLAGASVQETETIEKIAARVGRAFQIQDDILDETGTTQELGKPAHSDQRNHKPTYVTVNGMKKAKEDVEELSRQAISLLDGLEHSNPFLEELLRALIYRKK